MPRRSKRNILKHSQRSEEIEQPEEDNSEAMEQRSSNGHEKVDAPTASADSNECIEIPTLRSNDPLGLEQDLSLGVNLETASAENNKSSFNSSVIPYDPENPGLANFNRQCQRETNEWYLEATENARKKGADFETASAEINNIIETDFCGMEERNGHAILPDGTKEAAQVQYDPENPEILNLDLEERYIAFEREAAEEIDGALVCNEHDMSETGTASAEANSIFYKWPLPKQEYLTYLSSQIDREFIVASLYATKPEHKRNRAMPYFIRVKNPGSLRLGDRIRVLDSALIPRKGYEDLVNEEQVASTARNRQNLIANEIVREIGTKPWLFQGRINWQADASDFQIISSRSKREPGLVWKLKNRTTAMVSSKSLKRSSSVYLEQARMPWRKVCEGKPVWCEVVQPPMGSMVGPSYVLPPDPRFSTGKEKKVHEHCVVSAIEELKKAYFPFDESMETEAIRQTESVCSAALFALVESDEDKANELAILGVAVRQDDRFMVDFEASTFKQFVDLMKFWETEATVVAKISWGANPCARGTVAGLMRTGADNFRMRLWMRLRFQESKKGTADQDWDAICAGVPAIFQINEGAKLLRKRAELWGSGIPSTKAFEETSQGVVIGAMLGIRRQELRPTEELQYSSGLQLNERQLATADMILNIEPGLVVQIAPAGTGKTSAASAAIKQLIETRPDARIAMLAPTNVSLLKLVQEICPKTVGVRKLVILSSMAKQRYARQLEPFKEHLVLASVDEIQSEDGQEGMKRKEEILMNK